MQEWCQLFSVASPMGALIGMLKLKSQQFAKFDGFLGADKLCIKITG